MPRTPDRPTGALPRVVWAPVAAALLILLIGGAGLLWQQPLLFPSLGPTAFLQTETPQQPSAQPYNVVVGHLSGLLMGFLAVWVMHAANAPGVLSSHELTAPRVWASVLAVGLTLALGTLVRAPHPPAAATTLLASLGGFAPTWRSGLTVMAGVVLVAVFGELLRRIRLAQRAGARKNGSSA